MRVGVLPYYSEPDANPYQKLFCDALERRGIDVERIDCRRWFPLSTIRDKQIDVLHLDWMTGFYQGRNAAISQVKKFLLIRRLKQLPPIKLVWTMHNIYQHEKGRSAFEAQIVQEIINSCDALMVHSRAAMEIVRGEYDTPRDMPFEVISHGHYIDAYKNSVTKSAARAHLGISDAGNVILFFGRIRKYKGIEELIAAFGQSANRDDVLIIAGQPFAGYPMAKLDKVIAEQCVERRVLVHGRHIKDDELQCFFNASDIVALPFKNILNSGSLLLAMSFGKPVVAPRIGSVPEVAHPHSYFGYEPNCPDGLSHALSAALGNLGHGESTNKIIAYTEEHYGWGKIAHQLSDLYCKLLCEDPRS